MLPVVCRSDAAVQTMCAPFYLRGAQTTAQSRHAAVQTMCRGAVFHTLVPHIHRHCTSSLAFSFLLFSDHVRTISSLRRSNECTVSRGIQSLPSTTLVQNSWAASATWGSARPPGGAKAQHFTLQCMTALTAVDDQGGEEEEGGGGGGRRSRSYREA